MLESSWSRGEGITPAYSDENQARAVHAGRFVVFVISPPGASVGTERTPMRSVLSLFRRRMRRLTGYTSRTSSRIAEASSMDHV